jgi:uncharacterized protein (DUF433 family)
VTARSDSQLDVCNPDIHGGEPVIHGGRGSVCSIVTSGARYGDFEPVAPAISVEAAAVRAAPGYR